MSAPPLATSFLQDPSFLDVLYIIAFALFIQGLRGLSGPTTAVRGNRIAAVGMGIAVIATLLNRNEGNWGLIALGIALGAAVGVPAARQVKMTAMPQMVALFNGVGGGAVFLISWSEFRLTHGYTGTATYITIFSLFAAIVGSVSFWGSNIAFGKLQEIIPGRPISLARPSRSSTCCCSPWPSPLAWTSSRARIPSCCSSACWSARRCSVTRSCCRSAAPTCRS